MELENHMTNALGHLVPRDLVSEIDLLRNDLVMEIVYKAIGTRNLLRDFKQQTMDDINAFVDLSAERYGAKLGGKKGNITLTSYDGRYKVMRQLQEFIQFDERLQIAKDLIDECIRRWGADSRPEIRALVNYAFAVDSAGRINTARVLGLRKLEITDEKWLQAMEAISDSVDVVGSKMYVRVYERIGNTDKFVPISLDIASA